MKPKLWFLQAESTGTPSGDSAAAAPAAAPAAEAPAADFAAPAADNNAEAGAPAADNNDDFGSLARTEAQDDAALEAAPKPAEKPAEVKPAEVKPAAEVKPVEVKPAEVKPAAAEQPKAAEAPAETPEAKAAREKAETDAFTAQETKLFSGLVEYYKLPDDMAEKLTTEPENVLPHLAARVHQAVAKGVQRLLAEQLPHMIQAHTAYTDKESAAKKAFYDVWPALTGHETEVLNAAALFQQLNPKATPEQRIKAVGRIVSESLGIAVAAPAGGTPPGGPAPDAAPKPAPFKPGGAGGGGGGQPPASDNEFAQIALNDE